MRLITADDLRTAVRFEDLVEPVADAFVAFSRGHATSELIVMFPAPQRSDGDVYVKTGTITGSSTYAVKVSPWFAANAAQDKRQGGFVAVFDAETGYTKAIIDDEHLLSDLRTAAAGVLAARHLAPVHVNTALMIGTGTQGFWQPQALAHERHFERLLIWGRSAQRADDLVHRLRGALPDVELTPVSDLRDAVEAADVILMGTSAREPLLMGEWLRGGQHVTSVGSDDHTKAELDAESLRRADRLIVDSIAGATRNGSVYRHLAAGTIDEDAITGELGNVIDAGLPGRTSEDELTVVSLMGLGVQDLAAASAAVSAIDARR